jgi:hypothetical protein
MEMDWSFLHSRKHSTPKDSIHPRKVIDESEKHLQKHRSGRVFKERGITIA